MAQIVPRPGKGGMSWLVRIQDPQTGHTFNRTWREHPKEPLVLTLSHGKLRKGSYTTVNVDLIEAWAEEWRSARNYNVIPDPKSGTIKLSAYWPEAWAAIRPPAQRT